MSITWFIVVFVLYLIANFAISYFAGRGAKTTTEFTLGKVGPVVLAFSFFAARLSAGIYMGEPGILYTSGWPYAWVGILNAAFWTASILVVTRRMRAYAGSLGSLTVPEFLGQRYGSSFLRIWTCIGCSIFYILLMVAQYKGAVALFSTLFGLDKRFVIVALSIISVLVVSTGGFKSVAWTTFFQGIIMIAVGLIIFLVAFKEVGWSFADVNTQLAQVDPNLARPFAESGLYSLGGVIALPFYLFISLVSNPYCTIRLMALTDCSKKNFKKFSMTLISIGMICFLLYCSGLFGRVLFPNLADADSVIPTIAMTYLPNWLVAVVAVGLFAALTSTVNSMLQTVSSMISIDLYKSNINKNATDKQVMTVNRIATFVTILVVLFIAYFYMPDLLSMLSLIAGTGSGLVTFAPLLVGLYWDKTTKAGAIAGSLAGVGGFVFFYFCCNFNLWIKGVAAALLAVVVTMIVSHFTKPIDAQILARMKGVETAG